MYRRKKTPIDWHTGKTYEEMYGVEKARELKEKRRKNWQDNNPMKRPEVAAKTSKTLMGHSVSEHTLQVLRTVNLGRKQPEEYKQMMRNLMKGNTYGFKNGHKPWNTGLTKETDTKLENLSGWAGKTFSTEHKQKLKAARANQIMPVMNTTPEITVQDILKTLNIPFKTHVPILLSNGSYHQVDILLNSHDVIEVEGCFWHQCEICEYTEGYSGKTAQEIREYDEIRDNLLREKGFNVHRIWEHETEDTIQLTTKLEQLFKVN